MSEHSKGPWTYENRDDNVFCGGIFDADQCLIGEVIDDSCGRDESDANGRLMAASPELVAACCDDPAGRPLAILLDDVAFVLDGFEQNSLAARCRMKAKKVRAALEKAGVKP